MNRVNWFIKQGFYLVFVAICGAGLSFIKEIIFARRFGVTSVADAYVLAIQVPEILFSVIWTAINQTVVATYTKEYRLGKKASNRFFSNYLTILMVLMTVFIIICEIAAEVIIKIFAGGFDRETFLLTVSLFRCVVPIIWFEGIVRVCASILTVHNKVLFSRIINCIRYIFIMASLLFFSRKFGIYAAAYGFLIGLIIEGCMSYIAVRPHERYHVVIDLKDSSIKRVFGTSIPVFISTGIGGINHVVDRAIASGLVAGSLASLNYASKLGGVISGLFTGGVLALIYPEFSKLVSINEQKRLSERYSQALSMVLLLVIPTIFGGWLLRNDLVALVFERGAFNSDSTKVVSLLFVIYLMSDLFGVMCAVTVSLYNSLGDTVTPMKNSMIGVFFNIILNVILSYYFSVYGLAMATLCTNIILSMRIMIVARKRVLHISYKNNLNVLLRSIICSFGMVIAIMVINTLEGYLLDEGTGIKFVLTVSKVVLGIAVYVSVHLLLKTKEIVYINKIIAGRIFSFARD